MRLRGMSHWAVTGVCILGVSGAVACSGNSNGFEDEMGPLLFGQARLAQKLDGVLGPLSQESSSTGNMATAARLSPNAEKRSTAPTWILCVSPRDGKR